MSQIEVRKGRFVLFFMQIFATLAFSVLFSSLALYASGNLGLSPKRAVAITGSFLAFNYALHVLGGYIGGRLFSYRGLFLLGMVLQAIGGVVLSFPLEANLIWGLAIFLTGAGLNVICINCMLTQLFEPEDHHRESAFLWNYSGMNLGFFLGFALSGYFQIHRDLSTAFFLGAFGNGIAFVLTLFNWNLLRDRGTHYAASRHKKKRCLLGLLLTLGLFLALSQLLDYASFSNELILLVGLIVCGIWGFLAFQKESQKLFAFLILALCSLVFWTLYQMAPMGLTLFYKNNVEHTLFGFEIAPQWILNINSFLIIVGGPTLAYLNQHFRKKGYKISLPFQFSTALFLIGFGFLLLPLGIFFANSLGITKIYWVILCYVFQSVGELFISPIGYAMVGRLIPTRFQAFAMGTWLMVTGVAAVLATVFSEYALGSHQLLHPTQTNPRYAASFLLLSIFAFVAGVLMVFLRKRLHRMIAM